MIKWKITRVQRFVAPKLRLGTQIKNRIAKAALGSILYNIKNQQQADGSLLKENSPGTRRSKASRGTLWRGVAMSLVDSEHRFVKPANWSMNWDDAALTIKPIGPLTEGVEDGTPLYIAVQEKDYVGWFAVNNEGMIAISQILIDWVVKKMEAAQARGEDAEVDGGEDVPVEDPDED